MRTTKGQGRLPARVRSALRAVEDAYTSAGPDQWTAALERLTAACAELSDGDRDHVARELRAAKGRVEAREFLTRARAALTAGILRTVRTLPDGVEVVEVLSDEMDQLLVVVPTTDGLGGAALDLAQQARVAVLAGECPRCGGQLEVQTASQLTVAHRPGCRLARHR